MEKDAPDLDKEQPDGAGPPAASGDLPEGGRDQAAPPSSRRLLIRKVAAGFTMTGLCSGAVYADYRIGLDICFHVIVVILTVKGLSEFYAMCESSRTAPFRRFGTISAVALVLFHWVSMPGTLAWFGLVQSEGSSVANVALLMREIVTFGLVVAVLGALWLQATKRDNDLTFEAISSTLFGVLYMWFLPSFLVKLRHMDAQGFLGGDDWNRVGTHLLLACIMVSKFTDVGAYLFGRKIGRTKLIPRISPNKTWEGLAAGLTLSMAVAFLLWWLRMLPIDPRCATLDAAGLACRAAPWRVVVFGGLVGGMGALGDLAESLLKRGSGKKDAGALVPGFGGVLDVIDSLLVSAPVAYFLTIVLLRVGGI